MRSLTILALLAGCAPAPELTVAPPAYVPAHSPSALSGVPRALIEVRPFRDAPDRAPDDLGELRDSDGRLEQRLRIAPSPAILLGQAVSAELAAAGHRLTGAGAPVVIEGAVQRFAATVPPGAPWNAEIAAQMTVTLRQRGNTTSRGYSSTCRDVYLLRPGEGALADLAADCITVIAVQFRNDPAIARALVGG